MIEPQTLKFLKGLKKNNNKPWFDAHRKEYEAAKTDFQNFIQLVIDDIGRSDLSVAGLSARDCMFRINRDIRFSKNKAPYKSNFGASIKAGGKKANTAGYYFHLEPGMSFAGGGLWMPEAADLKKLRQEIDYCFDEFQSIIKAPAFKKTFGDLDKHEDFSLSTTPKGYEKDNPAIEYLKLKCFIAEVSIKDEDLTKGSLHKKTVTVFENMQPLLQFINRALGSD